MFRSPVGLGADRSACGLQANHPCSPASSFGRRSLISALQRESACDHGANESLPAGEQRANESLPAGSGVGMGGGARASMNIKSQDGQFNVTPPSCHCEGGGICNIREKAAAQAQVTLLN